ncbi:MAG TPA: hypothetical protein VGM88_26755 [Kofleriaceae bacterium]|jgi:hypothetical protein
MSALLMLAMAAPIASADHAYVPDPPVAAPHFAQQPGSPRIARRHTPPIVEDEPDPVAVDRDTVRTQLIQNRATNLARFRAYVAAGSYPSNTFQPTTLNVWRDNDGHFCAAATIIRASGAVLLVDRVAEQANNIKLGDVKQGPLMDWMLTSGLTQEEIALIQRPFRPVSNAPDPQIIPDRRVAETDRLKKLYAEIDSTLTANAATSIETATSRLLAHPDLAWQVVQTHGQPLPQLPASPRS